MYVPAHFSMTTDDIAIVKSMATDNFNHGPAKLFANTGSTMPNRCA